MTDKPVLPDAASLPTPQAVLDYIQAVGMKFLGAVDAELDARKAEKTAKADEKPKTPLTDLGLTYARASRALRLTLMLKAQLAGEAPWPQRRVSAPPEPDPSAQEAAAHDARLASVCESRKLRILRTLAGSACNERNDYGEIERLVRQGAERLEDEDLQDDLMSLPLGELVRRIAKDVGLEADWPGLDQRLWGKFETIPQSPPPPDPSPTPGKRQTCLDRPDPVLATRKGPGPLPRILISTITYPPPRPGLEQVRPP